MPEPTSAKTNCDAALAAEQVEEQAKATEVNQRRTLGTFADLLAESNKKRS